ncbi:uncharacterized protein HMPREF1541_11143 [Cyphellophora europaea CBS 101466]|uniref:AB hydrolase-1 domain-containing protein n=1 Tax=Cyphellophora europaea (strain CBS 101466) TaxID=1220924 RepID=W2S7B4_CYPE1|nr:uncharacterized protein HMPREF1541_11143 [Cyphellophora europaea CBS 101466]ETN43819.1 hypothetical protein HMPREF1541_11143 [Cyphellophora europaea CBS 101466]
MDAEVKSMRVRLEPTASESAAGPTHLELLYQKPPGTSTEMPTILMLPFWGGSASTYRPVLATMASELPSSISLAVSYRGTGGSAPPDPDSPDQHSVPALANDVVKLMQADQIQELIPSKRLVICAHSMSAKVTVQLLRKLEISNARFGIEGIVFLAPAPPGPFELSSDMREQQLTAYQSRESAEWVLRNVLTTGKLNAEQYRTLAENCFNMSPGAKRGWIERGMQWSCLDTLAALRTKPKVRILVGSNDLVEPVERVKTETLEILRMQGFDVEVQMVEGSGHLLPVEAPGAVVQEVKNMVEGK